jgi:hypothetical protein
MDAPGCYGEDGRVVALFIRRKDNYLSTGSRIDYCFMSDALKQASGRAAGDTNL